MIQGVPGEFRPQFWFYASGAAREKKNNKGYYQNILNNYPDNIPSNWENIIDADIPRTFPDEKNLNEDDPKKLKNILLAYSRRNPKIGYCQGFNYFAARLLFIFENEENTFWVFTQVLENILPNDYFSELNGMMVDCLVVSNLCNNIKEIKEIKDHITNLNADICLKNLFYKWFDSLYADGCSFLNFYVIWDAMMLDGNIVLFRATLAILEELKDQILKLNDFNELNEFFEEKIKEENFNNGKFMSKLLDSHHFGFNMDYIWELREKCYKDVYESIKRTKEVEAKSKENKEKEICDIEWPFCVETINDFYIQRVEILKTGDYDNKLIDYDFFDENVNDKINIKENKIINEDEKKLNEEEINKKKSEIYHNLLIQRDVHKCKINVQNSNNIKTPQSSPMLQKNVYVSFIPEMLGDLDLKLQNSLSQVELEKETENIDDE